MPVQVVLVDFWNWNFPPVKGKKTNGEGEIKVKNNNQTTFWKIKKKRTVAFKQHALCRDVSSCNIASHAVTSGESMITKGIP